MAEATKHNNLPINGGTLISDMKSLFSIIKTRRTVAFAYGFMFAFVAFTVFLAFNPNPNSGAPWFTNIFTTSSTATTSGSGSQFSSFFSSFFYPNASSSSSSSQQFQTFVPSPQTQPSRSSNTTVNKQPPSQTQPIVNSDKPQVLSPNQTSDSPSNASLATQDSSNLPKQTLVKNQTQTTPNSDKATVLEANQTTVAAPITPVVAPANKTTSSPPKSGSSGKNDPKSVAEKGVTSNYTDVLKKQSNETKSSVSVKEGKDDLIKSLLSCDLFHGEWVEDDSYPLYEPGSCPLIDEQFNCIRNGRPDKDYQKFKWQPKDCNLPRLDGSHMLELLRGKRLVFVGDSLNRNMWESLVCILRNSAKDKSKVYEAHGRTHFRGEASYSFIFKDYSCTVEFFVSPFLVREWEMPDKDGSKKETLRLDLVGRSSNLYKDADILIFNTGHWWTHDKTAKGKDYYQEGSHVYGELNVLEAFRKALTTWSRWVDASVDTGKSMVFFRGYSASHFSGGQWNSGGQCDSETLPIFNETYLRPYPPKMLVLEKVLKNMKHHITYLNITRLTDFRKDGHPSIYRKQNLSPAERKSPKSFQDCSHWCLPGVPDAWNEVLYAELLVKLHKKNLHQQLQQQKKKA